MNFSVIRVVMADRFAETGLVVILSHSDKAMSAVPAVKMPGRNNVYEQPSMPSALEIAQALSKLFSAKLANQSAERIELNREEATVCLGLIHGVVENLEAINRNGV